MDIIIKEHTVVKNGLRYEMAKDGYVITAYYGYGDGNLLIPATCDNIPVVGIKSAAFQGCNLKNVIISEGIITLGDKAFYNCQNLNTVTIPTTVSYIGYSAFERCPLLYAAIYMGTKNACNNISICDYNYNMVRVLRAYSKEQPATTGKYWHYDTDGKTPIIW